MNLFGEGEGALGENSSPQAADGEQGDLKNVVYGKTETTEKNDTDSSEKSTEDLRKEYDEMIRGKYKDFYTKDTQDMINKRFKANKDLESKLNSYAPLMDMLSQRYGVDGNDIASVTKAIEDDDATWEEAADREGLSVDQFKQLSKLKSKNAMLEKEAEERQRQENAQRTLDSWRMQSEELKRTFPNFDLETEVQNQEFASMIQRGVSLDAAYKVVHMDDIVTSSMRNVRQATEKQVADNIRATGNRPTEAGANKSSNGFVTKPDVNSWTKEDILEVARRAKRGETINL